MKDCAFINHVTQTNDVVFMGRKIQTRTHPKQNRIVTQIVSRIQENLIPT